MALDTILLAIGSNDEERAEALADAVAEVAEPTGAAVIIAHVFGEDEYERIHDRLQEGDEDSLTPHQVAQRHAAVRGIDERLRSAGIRPEVHGSIGERASTVIELAEEFGADRIVIGGRERTPAGKAVFGSTAQEILLAAPCPVTFVRGK